MSRHDVLVDRLMRTLDDVSEEHKVATRKHEKHLKNFRAALDELAEALGTTATTFEDLETEAPTDV